MACTLLVLVAVSPPAVPVGTAPPLSALSELTRPPPTPVVWARTVTPVGAVHPVVLLVLSVHSDTSQEPGAVTSTVGVVWDARLIDSTSTAKAASGFARSVPA